MSESSKTFVAWSVIIIGTMIELFIVTLDVPPLILHVGWDGVRWIKH